MALNRLSLKIDFFLLVNFYIDILLIYYNLLQNDEFLCFIDILDNKIIIIYDNLVSKPLLEKIS